MRLNEILEENTINSISQKTKIAEVNLENLLASNFDALKKIKTLGFISIIEREYKADLSALREEALEYYGQNKENHNFAVVAPLEEERRGRSKLFLFVVLALLGYASWYFFTQFDKKHLSELIPFMNEQVVESLVTENDVNKKDAVADLSIGNVVFGETKANVVVEETVEENVPQETTQSSETTVVEVNDSIEAVSQF